MPNSSIPHCKYCNSENLIRKENLAGLHWGAIVCGDCNRHKEWLPNPVITQKFQEREKIISHALASGRIVGWENLFLRSIQSRRYLTGKQEEKFFEICDRHKLKIPVS